LASFLTFNNIRSTNEKTYSEDLIERAGRNEKEGATFLSYLAKEGEYLPTIIGILENHGTSVYLEKQDPTLEPASSTETAGTLRQNITLASRVVLFVTPESIDNYWNPWLLGIADGTKGASKIALFPVANKAFDQKWSEQSYLGMYDRIIWGHIKGKKNEWLVLNTIENSAIGLRSWLSAL